MSITLNLALKLQKLSEGEVIPSSKLKQLLFAKLLEDGVLKQRISGRSKTVYFISERSAFEDYLKNLFGIGSLTDYIEALQKIDLTRAEAIEVSSDSKIKTIRTFKGFLVNSYEPIKTSLDGSSLIIAPTEGILNHIFDFENFLPDPSVTIVGIENPENFRYIHKQKELFRNLRPLFVCRYSQNNDLIKWLQIIPNPYLHFGDLDFAGIEIYLTQFKKHLGERASFFFPEKTENLLKKHGNRNLYIKQREVNTSVIPPDEPWLTHLVNLIHKYKKGLEQEVFIGR